MINKKGTCSECGNDSIITKPSLGLCFKCNNKRLRKMKINKSKASGQYDLFLEIWKEREHFSFVSGQTLAHLRHTKVFVNVFAHVLSKGAFPRFKLKKENIVLLTPQEHFLFDHGSEYQREVYAKNNNCSWEPLYELKQQLTEEYYE